MNTMDHSYLDQMITYFELRSKDKHNDKIDAMADGLISLKSLMNESDSVLIKRHIASDATTESRGLRSIVSFHDEFIDPLWMKSVPCLTFDSVPRFINEHSGYPITIPKYFGNHSCFYPIDMSSLSNYSISTLVYNENKYNRRMSISERINLDIKILIVESHGRYLSSSGKKTVYDYSFYTNHSLQIPRYHPLNARGMTKPIIFEPWI